MAVTDSGAEVLIRRYNPPPPHPVAPKEMAQSVPTVSRELIKPLEEEAEVSEKEKGELSALNGPHMQV